MEQRKRRHGDRYDGRRVRTMHPMDYIGPFIMTRRSGASNYLKIDFDMDMLDKYMHHLRQEKNMPGLGFMHLFAAAYIRTISQRPALNRFVAGKRIFARNDIVLSMMVKKEMSLDAQETSIKVHFQPTDTIYDVYHKMNEQIAIAKGEGDTTSLDNTTRALFRLPTFLLSGFISILRQLDFVGWMPKMLNEVSPFHASVFVTNLGSLGIAPVYHHLYDFGNCPLFLAFGAKHYTRIINKDGEVERKKYITATVVLDERITDGYNFASATKYCMEVLQHPEQLENPPESVVEDID